MNVKVGDKSLGRRITFGAYGSLLVNIGAIGHRKEAFSLEN
jgi:hypothetical protein